MSGPVQSNDHVRLALPSEAPRIAEVQRRAWDAQPDTGAGAALLANVDAEAMVSAWTRAVTAPPAARYRVLVALADNEASRDPGYDVARRQTASFLMSSGQRVLGAGVVAVLCLTVAAPLGFGAELANSQRQLLERLFPALSGGTPAAEAIGKARLNVLLVGSDAGPDRRGTRTDTMMVASVDTRTGRTILFGLPRNLQRVPFPAGSPMAREFPRASTTRRTRSPATTCSTLCTPTHTAIPRSRRADPPRTPA